MNNFTEKKFFITVFLLMLNFIFLSFLGYYFPWLKLIGFILILLLTFYLSLKNLSRGALIIVAELFLSSFGRLLTVDILNFQLSLRMALFIVIFIALIINLLRKKFVIDFTNFIFKKPLLLLLICLSWALVNGFIHNYNLSDIYNDANAFLFLAYLLVLVPLVNNQKIIIKILLILAASIFVSGLITLTYFLIFAYQPPIDLLLAYKWYRDVRLGEITHVFSNIYRIFSQAQIFSLIGLFVFFTVYLAKYSQNIKFLKEKIILKYLLVTVLTANLTIIISFSRSYWVGLLAGWLFLMVILLVKLKINYKILIKISSFLIGITIINLLFLYVISGSFSPDLIKNRLTGLLSESASASRLQQLTPLFQNIKDNFIFGAGFGKTVSYYSSDPRILQVSPTGQYTTFAFEWGYLDLLLKLGIIGFIVYWYLLIKIFKTGLGLLDQQTLPEIRLLILGILIGLIALIFTNVFSPYLNHPLGLGYLIISMTIINFYAKNQKTFSSN